MFWDWNNRDKDNNLWNSLIRLENTQKETNRLLQEIQKGTTNMSAALDALTAQVAQNAAAEATAVALIKQLAADLKAAIATDDSAAIMALNAQLQSSANALSTEVTADTPASNTANVVVANT